MKELDYKNEQEYVSPEVRTILVEMGNIICESGTNEKVTETDSEW